MCMQVCAGRIYVKAHDHTYHSTVTPHTCIRDDGRVVRAQVYTATTRCALVTTEKPGRIVQKVKSQVSFMDSSLDLNGPPAGGEAVCAQLAG